ncbi:ATP-binding protein [Waterburya agarophytonicola K14]|uniref:ATP-binding protein n=1 Tax=Waterburya agarophytonicola KI4 TaxID=2874699 RepID=A0A964FHU3_9CYAN|nr:ATP-binding protein [Waterburya agarophytonicola]MCC0179367.1 ATP-binding protein [Waterburya agarophytonicola KI4]
MARSLKVSPQYIAPIKQAVKRNGFPSQKALAIELGLSLSTVKSFLNGRPVDYLNFVEIAEKLGLDWQEISQINEVKQQATIPNNFFSYDSSWVGRDKLITELSQNLHNSYRFLLILGLTGIGKTALAERLVVGLQDLIQGDWDNKLLRVNFDNEDKITDFTSVAARWLESLGENISPAEKKPELILNRLVRRLQDNQFLVLIDSMERLLTENDDEYWENFFLALLSAESCQSKLIVTSQDLSVDFHSKASRYNNFYQRHILYGLNELEQEALFEIEGLDISQESEDRAILLRLGKAYKGHPLVLRVIIGEINSHPFNGNVQAYWNDVNKKIKEVEKDLTEAEAGKTEGYDEWELHKLTREVRNEVNRKRLQATFQRLETQVPDAYILICAASVYRIPVKKEGWLMQLAALVRRVEKQVCSLERQEQALEELLNRFLVEESINHNNKRVLGQHNLVRSVALENYINLIQKLQAEKQSA